MHLEVAGRTHVGLVRSRNEDAFYVSPGEHGGGPLAVLAVADGVGGAPGGDRASAAAMETIAGAALDASEDAVRNVIAEADEAVRAVAEQERLIGACTTVVLAVVQPGAAWIAHVGDSRAYRVARAGGPAERLTRDHSWVQEQVDAGAIPADRTDAHPQRNVITRALGIPGSSAPDLAYSALAAGDCLLLCTDGLTEVVDDSAIASVLRGAGSAEEAVEALVQRALTGGGPDNVAVAVASVVES